MSYREEKIKSLIGSDYTDCNTRKLQDHCDSILDRGVHGLCFSPYEGVQKPGDNISRKIKFVEDLKSSNRIPNGSEFSLAPMAMN